MQTVQRPAVRQCDNIDHGRLHAGRLSLFLAILLLVLTVASVYSNSLKAPFYFDDHGYILEDAAIRMTSIDRDSLQKAVFESRPRHRYIPNLSFALNYYFGRYNPFGYHIINIAIHILCAIFLFFFIRITLAARHAQTAKRLSYAEEHSKYTNPVLIAFFASLIWAVHPTATESVTYIVQRMTSLAAMFYILSLLLYAKGRANQIKDEKKPAFLYFAACFVSGAFAIASKENTATLPVFILLYEWFFFQDLKRPRKWQRLVAVSMVCAIFAGIAIWYLGTDPMSRILASYTHRNFTLPQRVMTEWRVIIYYISLMFWPLPSRLNLDYNYPLSVSLSNPLTTLPCLVAIMLLLFAAIIIAKKERIVSFCILWFFGNLMIESTVIGIEIIFDHRLYLPMMMASLAFVVLIFRLSVRKIIPAAILCTIAIFFASWTWQRNKIWQNPVYFWKDNLKKSCNKARTYKNLAFTLQKKGETAEAVHYYKLALKAGPAEFATLNNLGAAMMAEKKYLAAIEYFEKALLLQPKNLKVLTSKGLALFYAGKFRMCKKAFKAALRIDPGYKPAMDGLAKLRDFIKKYPDDKQRISAMIKNNGKSPALLLAMGELGEKEGDLPGAIALYKNALLLVGPKDTTAAVMCLSSLAGAEAACGRYEDSISHFKRLTIILPENPMFYYNIAALLAVLGKNKQAVSYLAKAGDKGLDVKKKIFGKKIWNSVIKAPEFKRVFQQTAK